MDIDKLLKGISSGAAEEFGRKKRILSFREFLEMFCAEPVALSRASAQYILDVFEHFGAEDVAVDADLGRPARRAVEGQDRLPEQPERREVGVVEQLRRAEGQVERRGGGPDRRKRQRQLSPVRQGDPRRFDLVGGGRQPARNGPM